jgi:hypothetical protein
MVHVAICSHLRFFAFLFAVSLLVIYRIGSKIWRLVSPTSLGNIDISWKLEHHSQNKIWHSNPTRTRIHNTTSLGESDMFCAKKKTLGNFGEKNQLFIFLRMTTINQELFSSFVQHINQMAQKLQHVQGLQTMVDTENTYEGKISIYDTMKLRMDEFDKLKIMTLDLHAQLQTILDAKQLMEIDELMKRINIL